MIAQKALLRTQQLRSPARVAVRIASSAFSNTTSSAHKPVFVDGARIPFTLSGTVYKDLMAVDLGKLALAGLLHRNPELDPATIDYLLYGTVIQESRTSNIAREAAMAAGIPINVPSHAIAQACISANQAICTGIEKIMAGQAEIVVAGGCETFSDLPIRLSRGLRQRLIAFPKASKKGPAGIMGLMKGLSGKDISLETPAIANYTTGEVMGHSSDRLAGRFGVTRREQDEFAVQSHLNAAKAHKEGYYTNEIIPVNGSTVENGIKADTSVEKMGKLAPAFVKPHGTHTAANSSFLSDGASAALIMTEKKAKSLGLKPRSTFKSWTFVGVDPFEDLLLGPTIGIHKVLKDAKLTLKDIDVFEIHEAFAGQVLANLRAMESDSFAKQYFNGGDAIGVVPREKLNNWGGSLSLGHPFGATGTRIVTTATNRLHKEGGRYALIAACADGGLAHAAIIERYDS